MIHLYGIPNCTTVKKARQWLEHNALAYEFHDFKKEAPSSEFLSDCLNSIALDTLINKRGTTWRKLSPEEQQQSSDKTTAIALMQTHPSVIKRPILVYQQHIVCGFDEAKYQHIFQAA